MAERHLFVIEDSVAAAMNPAEVRETTAGLHAMGLYHLPAPAIDITYSMRGMLAHVRDDANTQAEWGPRIHACTVPGEMDYRVTNIRETFPAETDGRLHFDFSFADLTILHGGGKRFRIRDMADRDNVMWSIVDAVNILICALAARNIEKQVVRRKRTKFGIGKRNPYTHITTIRVPNTRYLSDDTDHPPTGRTVRAHFRRGFVRDQHHGAGNQLVKKIWIAPVFVNADGDWVDQQQKTYRLVA